MVEKEFQQLRFDVSENIRLHPQKPGIGTLLELDLFPDVECKDEGKQLKIEGFLRLNGVYMEEKQKDGQLSESSEDGWEEISYVIPVEIILPADRAELEHISAEVESFDYSIVSPYELRITAILLIDGILPEVEEERLEKVEAYEVIHEEPTFSAEPVKLASLSEEEKESEPVPQLEKKMEVKKEKNSPPSERQLRGEEGGKPEQSNKVELKEEKQDVVPLFSKQVDQPKEEGKEQEKAKEMAESLVKGKESLKVDDEKEKQLSETEVDEEHEKDLANEQEEEAIEAVEEKRKSPEWIDWLVRNREESYEPMRMVIVQRGQPIDHLAEQYQVNKDRLIEVNQLKTDFIDEGAILYIPKERQSEAEGL